MNRTTVLIFLALTVALSVAGCAPGTASQQPPSATAELPADAPTINPTTDVVAGLLTASAPTLRAMTQNPLATVQPTARTIVDVNTSTPRPGPETKQNPCKIGDAPELYLVIEGERRHIIDWATFEALGYLQEDIILCGADTSLPEGAPITRLFKGSGDPVYWIDNGYRRHIPDMTTFTSMGLRTEDITTLPDDILEFWPIGLPIEPVSSPSGAPYKTVTIGDYTIRLYHADAGHGLYGYATISAPGQPDITVLDVESIADLPAEDITGEGNPDLVFLNRAVGSGHCCWGTTVYDLGATPVVVMKVYSTPYYGYALGRGDFKDLNGDGVYEFVTHDPYIGPCSTGNAVMSVLRYDASQQRYVGASPQFAAYYEEELARLNGYAQPGGPCYNYYSLVATLLYIGRADDARATFDRMYTGENAETDWSLLKSAVEKCSYYVPAN